MMDFYYTINTLIRIAVCLYCAQVFLGQADPGKLLRAFGWFFFGMVTSFGIFFARNYLPAELELAMRMLGVTVQMVTLVSFALFLHQKDFD